MVLQAGDLAHPQSIQVGPDAVGQLPDVEALPAAVREREILQLGVLGPNCPRPPLRKEILLEPPYPRRRHLLHTDVGRPLQSADQRLAASGKGSNGRPASETSRVL
jgi:hypothetical protein